jgi:hypothetical protein
MVVDTFAYALAGLDGVSSWSADTEPRAWISVLTIPLHEARGAALAVPPCVIRDTRATGAKKTHRRETVRLNCPGGNIDRELGEITAKRFQLLHSTPCASFKFFF